MKQEEIDEAVRLCMVRHPSVRVEKKKTVKKSKLSIPLQRIVQYLVEPQPYAAEKLNVSISTLKRRYKELEVGRWPVNSTYADDTTRTKASITTLTQQDKLKVENLVNESDIDDESEVDRLTRFVLGVAFMINTD